MLKATFEGRYFRRDIGRDILKKSLIFVDDKASDFSMMKYNSLNYFKRGLGRKIISKLPGLTVMRFLSCLGLLLIYKVSY